MLRQAFAAIEPTPDGEEVFQRWNGKNLQSVVQEEFEEAKRVMAEGLRESFGEDFDLSTLDMSAESFARFSAEIEARLAAAERDAPRHAGNTARAMQAEMAAKIDAERLKRSIRTVYLNLAKALYPDTTLDEVERERRDDVMKTVTVAYDNNDLQTLLRIEMIELERGADRTNHLPDETLAIYNASLKEQVSGFEAELRGLRLHPRYTPIACLFNSNPDSLQGRLQREIERMTELIRRSESWVGLLPDDAAKKEVMIVLDKFCTEYDEEFAEWSGRPLKKPQWNFWDYLDRRY